MALKLSQFLWFEYFPLFHDSSVFVWILIYGSMAAQLKSFGDEVRPLLGRDA